MSEHRKNQLVRGEFGLGGGGAFSRSLPMHRALMPLTLDADDTRLDDRSKVELTVGDLRHIIRTHERAVSMIGEMALRGDVALSDKERSDVS